MTPPLNFADLVTDKLVAAAGFHGTDIADSLRKSGARDVLLLSPDGPEQAARMQSHVVRHYSGLKDVKSHNCEVVILNSTAIFALCQKRFFWGCNVLPIEGEVPHHYCSGICATIR